MIVCTSMCSNYLPKAMVLAKSLKESNPEVKMLVCLLEREIPQIATDFQYFDFVVLAKDLGFENFDKFIFKHSIVEAATSIKGQLFVYMLNHFLDEEKFVYLDPDIKVTGELKELEEALVKKEIVLTPHLCHPEDHIDAVMDNELCALQHGVFNLGFLGLKKGNESLKFANWWASRLNMFCYDDIPRGIFTDQKWIDLAPCFFDLFILKHSGYNAAPWNMSKRKIKIDEEGKYYANNEPLRFFHFSGFDSGANEGMINKYVPDKKNAVYTLRDKYVNELINYGQDSIGRTPWSYDYYTSGDKIDRESRITFRDHLELQYKYDNPFELSNEEMQGNYQVKAKKINSDVRELLRKIKNKLG